MGNIFNPKRPDPVPVPKTTQVDRQAQEAAERERERLRRARGRASTILTGPLGDSTPGATATATLGG